MPATRLNRAVAGLRSRLGPLGWGALLVFIIFRLGDFANLLYKVFLGRALSELDFGVIDPVMSVLIVLSIPVGVIFQIAMKSISRLQSLGRTAQCRALVRDLMRIAVVGSVAGLFVISLLGDYILERMHLDSNIYIYIIAFLFVLAWWQPLYLAILQGTRDYRLIALSSVLNPVTMLLLGVTFVLACGWGLKGALAARVCAGIVTVFAVMLLARRFWRGDTEQYSEERRMMKEMVVPMAVYMLSMAFLVHFDRIFVRNFFVEDSGGYGALVTMGSIPCYLLSPIGFVVFPLAAADHARGKGSIRYEKGMLLIGLAVSALGAVAFWLMGKPLLCVWNEVFVPYAGKLWLYAIAMGLGGTIELLSSVNLARHKYGFLWYLAVPTAVMCSGMYILRNRIDLGQIILMLVAVRVVILAGMMLNSSISRRGMKNGSCTTQQAGSPAAGITRA